ncbi:3-(aryl)acrylate reductase AcdA [soil metagenome]
MNTAVIENKTGTTWKELAHQLGKDFATRAADHDQNDSFVKENYEVLKNHRFFAAIIPKELGGEGVTHAEMCDILRIIAQNCSSTALALSMHQHLLSANIWKYKKGKGGEEMLRKVADQQLILISTGARDWLESNGEMVKVKDGYRVTAEKHFASQSAVGNVLVTSAPYKDPEKGWSVLHFPVPIKAEGVMVMDNWYALGMRGTGSHTVKLENVFVPEASIILTRPKGEFHMFWNVILTVAMPLIMSVYVGIAEKAARIAIEKAKNKKAAKPQATFQLGELQNELTTAQVLLKDMISLANGFDFDPVDEVGNAILVRKTLVANACMRTVGKALEIAGGQSFFRSSELERLFRDVQGAPHHPLPEKEQQHFTGMFLLGEKYIV